MCLGEIGQVASLRPDGQVAVRVRGAERTVHPLVPEALAPGDWVLLHSGFALERLSEDRALEALRIRHHEEATS